MRFRLASAFVLALVVLCARDLAPREARAEGPALGHLLVHDAGTICNRTTGGSATAAPTAFSVDFPAKFTAVCFQAGFIGTDIAGCDAGTCIPCAAGEKVTLQVKGSPTLTGKAYNWDGGAQSAPFSVAYTGGWFCAAPATGSAFIDVGAYPRTGAE